MSNLKNRLIRLGNTNPELRTHLRPILSSLDKTAGGYEFGGSLFSHPSRAAKALKMSQGKSPVYRILVDGTVEPMPDKNPNRKDLQQAVGGYFEIVTLSPTHIMIIDEEGVMKNKPLNKKASSLVGKRILGDVVILPSSYLD